MEKLLQFLKTNNLSMEEAFQLMNGMAANEFNAPRSQATIIIRVDRIIEHINLLLSYYSPDAAMAIMQEVIIRLMDDYPYLTNGLEKKEDLKDNKIDYSS